MPEEEIDANLNCMSLNKKNRIVGEVESEGEEETQSNKLALKFKRGNEDEELPISNI